MESGLYKFLKSMRLIKRWQYQHIAKQFTRHIGNWIIIDARRSSASTSRLGITVTRRYGNAVKRNRFKRLVRESFRLNHVSLLIGYDLNVKPRTAALKAKQEDIASDFINLLGPSKNY